MFFPGSGGGSRGNKRKTLSSSSSSSSSQLLVVHQGGGRGRGRGRGLSKIPFSLKESDDDESVCISPCLLSYRRRDRNSLLGLIKSPPPPQQQQQQKQYVCINDDLLFLHILPRLPVKSLLRFGSVSKHLYTLIHHDPTFVQTQFNYSKANAKSSSSSSSSSLAIFASDFEVRFHHLSSEEEDIDRGGAVGIVAFQTHTDEQHLSACTPPVRIICKCNYNTRWNDHRVPALFLGPYYCHRGAALCGRPPPPSTTTFHHPIAAWRPQRLVGSCNGLTCITTTTIGSTAVCVTTIGRKPITYMTINILNHSTRELLSIPKPKDPDDVLQAARGYKIMKTYNFGFGYDHIENEYKIVLLISCTARTCCMIYSLGSSSTSRSSNNVLCHWRDISHACPPMEAQRCHLPPLLSNGGLFWVQAGHASDDDDDRNQLIGQLVRFDIHSEEFQVIEAPPVPNNLSYKSFIEVGGKPSLWYCDVNAGKFHFYSMMVTDGGDGCNQVGRQSYYWIEGSFTLGFPADARDLTDAIHLVVSSSKQILIQWLNADGQYTLYNPHNDKRQHISAMGVLDPCTYSRRKADTVLLVNPVENLLSLKSLVTPDASGIEYVSSSEAPYCVRFGNASPLNYIGTGGYRYFNFI